MDVRRLGRWSGPVSHGRVPLLGAGASSLDEVGVGEVHVLGVLQPGRGEEDADVGRAVGYSDGDSVVADPAPALFIRVPLAGLT